MYTKKIITYFAILFSVISAMAQPLSIYPLSRIDSSLIAKNDAEIDQLIKEEEWKEATRFMNKNGQIFWEHNYLDQAIEYYKKSVEINDKLGNSNGISMINNNLGMIYADMKSYEKALICFEKTYVARKFQKAKIGMISALVNQAVVLNNLKRYDVSKKKLEEATVLALEKNDPEQIRLCYGMLAETSTMKGDMKDAVKYFELYETFFKLVEKSKTETAKEEAEKSKAQLKIAELEKQNQALKLKVQSKAIKEKDKIIKEKESNVTELRNQMTKAELLIENQKQELKITELLKSDLEQKEHAIRQRTIIGIVVFLLLVFVTIAFINIYRLKQKQNITNHRLRVLNDEIIQKNEALGHLMTFRNSLTNMLMHDLKVPLTVLSTNLVHINSAKHRKSAQAANQQMTQVVQNILDIETYRDATLPLDIKTVDLNQLIWSAIHTIEFIAEKKNLSLKFDTQKQYQADCDHSSILRVLVNILSNAVKYSLLNNQIEITIKEIEESKVQIGITNFGPKIPERDLESIFSIYKKNNPETTGVFKSTGIGLAYCKLSIDSHEQEIVVESDEKSTSFLFTLNGAGKTIDKSQRPLKANQDRKILIELTDDEKEYLERYAKEIANYEVFEITEITKVLHSIKNESPAIDNWKQKLNNTLLQFNEEEFHRLLSFEEKRSEVK